MASLTQPTIKTKTQDGECKIFITLELNINLTGDKLSITGTPVSAEIAPKSKDEEVQWAIPDFNSGIKVSFGKAEGE
jgi:hypothetical protein